MSADPQSLHAHCSMFSQKGGKQLSNIPRQLRLMAPDACLTSKHRLFGLSSTRVNYITPPDLSQQGEDSGSHCSAKAGRTDTVLVALQSKACVLHAVGACDARPKQLRGAVLVLLGLRSLPLPGHDGLLGCLQMCKTEQRAGKLQSGYVAHPIVSNPLKYGWPITMPTSLTCSTARQGARAALAIRLHKTCSTALSSHHQLFTPPNSSLTTACLPAHTVHKSKVIRYISTP